MEIIKPFKIIKQIKPVFLLFIIISLIIGQIGIIGSITLGGTETSLSMRELLIFNLDAGNLYTFSIALIATSFNQYFIDFLIEEEVLFKKYKIILAVVSIALIIFMTLFYSVHQLHSLENSLIKAENTIPKSLILDWTQIIFYFICLILSIYMFCVNFLKLDPESYIEIDDQNLLKLKKSTNKVGTDSQGAKV